MDDGVCGIRKQLMCIKVLIFVNSQQRSSLRIKQKSAFEPVFSFDE